MKVLVTTHQFFPEFTAGTEVLTLAVARELLRRGHEVRVYTGYPSRGELEGDERFDEYDFDGIHVYRFHHAYLPMAGQSSVIELGYDNHAAADRFEKILTHFDPDIVHAFHLNRLGTGLIEKADQLGVPLFMTLTDFWLICPTAQLLLPDGKMCHGPGPYGGNCVKHLAEIKQQGLPKAIARLLPVAVVEGVGRLLTSSFFPVNSAIAEVKAIGGRLHSNIARANRLKRLVVPNSVIRDMLIRNGIDERLIVELGYGIDLVESGRNSSSERPRRLLQVGYIGTLGHHKGCHVLVEAFNRIPRGLAVLKIFGNHVDFPEYVKRLKALAGDNREVQFCGTFENSDISSVIASLDVLVVPSVWVENTPLVVYSAQQGRCPVVASNCLGLSDLIKDGENGLLFEPGNDSELAGQLLRLIDDPGLVSRLSANARQPKSTATYVDELLSLWEGA